MLSLFVRALLVLGGTVASWLVANDALNYAVVKMVAAMFIFVLMVGIAVYWHSFFDWIRKIAGKR